MEEAERVYCTFLEKLRKTAEELSYENRKIERKKERSENINKN
jgi:hypothetical protein